MPARKENVKRTTDHGVRTTTIAIRLTNWVGDVVMGTPFLARVRALWPEARIVALGRKHVAALLEGHPDVDEVWTIDDRNFVGMREAAARLQPLRADLGFLLPNSLKAAALFRMGGVKKRIGYDRDARGILLTHPIKLRPEDLAVHEVRYYLRLLHQFETERVQTPPLKLAVSEAEKADMHEWLAKRQIGAEDFVVGVNPAAFYGTAKRWPADRYAAVATHLAKHHGAKVVVTGLPTERDVAQEVCDSSGIDGIVNGAGEMTLRQLMAFLDRANLYLTNDSGAMHIAAALGCPLIAVFGSTDWVTTAPLGDHCRIVRVETPCAPCLLRHCPIDHRCMTGVAPQMVIDAAEGLIASSSSASS